MEQETLIIEQVYAATPEALWKALTDKEEMKKWYFTLDRFEPRAGFEFSFYGEGRQGEKYLHRCRVTAAEENKKLAYSWCYEGFDGFSEVSFELAAIAPGQTSLRVTHTGLGSFPAGNPDFARSSFTEGWNYITGTSLRQYLEGNTA